MSINYYITGLVATALAGLGFLLLETFGIRWSPARQWITGLSILVVFLWLVAQLFLEIAASC